MLKMPEKEAFAALVNIMEVRKFRKLLLNNFYDLSVLLESLMLIFQDKIPKIYIHMKRINLHPFYYAFQWVACLFSSKFPLIFVSRVYDILLLHNPEQFIPLLVSIIVHLFRINKEHIILLDFESCMEYLYSILPKSLLEPKNLNHFFKTLPNYVIESSKLETYIENGNKLLEKTNPDLVKKINDKIEDAETRKANIELLNKYDELYKNVSKMREDAFEIQNKVFL